MTEPRTILITGATRGLGRALAREFAARGHVVKGCGSNAGLVDELAGELPPPHGFAAIDVSDSAAVEAWADEVVGGGAIPDLVINNAALMNAPAPLWEIPADDFGRLMDVNVDGTVNVIRAFLPAMLQAGRGVVVNLSSGWGRSTSPEVGPYCASKYAVEGLTGSLAAELPAPMAAVAFSPGVVDTDMLRLAWADGADGSIKPAAWAPAAADRLLGLGRAENGRSLSV